MRSRKTTPEERSLLLQAGMVRVDGLPAKRIYPEEEVVIPAVGLEASGRYYWNNSMLVVVSNETTEVWIGAYSEDSVVVDRRKEILLKLCPEGNSFIWVPCSNGESINLRDVLQRMANPDYIPMH